MDCFLRTYDDTNTLISEISVTAAASCEPGAIARAVGWLDPTAATVFLFPSSEQMLVAWGLGFGLPCSLYLVAYCVQAVVGMFGKG